MNERAGWRVRRRGREEGVREEGGRETGTRVQTLQQREGGLESRRIETEMDMTTRELGIS